MHDGLVTRQNKRRRNMDDAAKLLLLLWRTWHVRNQITHNSGMPSVTCSVRFLQKYWDELCHIKIEDGVYDSKRKKPVLSSLVVCINMIGLLSKEDSHRSSLRFITREAVDAGRNLPELIIKHTKREQNYAAHELAQLAKRTEHGVV
ncbi:hypothetical protein BAE44_0004595 [Dichanthelium oligosanthes]|uniref:RNase H type-1 domain-containing protein n=1 Tax=Dichanthelium oligosanthes TaxID=888268 RepID=A0A1E5WAD3_9POAL|nr:hypothetical protein BAE44_0004595 [Dichanthelium oligosanthes]